MDLPLEQNIPPPKSKEEFRALDPYEDSDEEFTEPTARQARPHSVISDVDGEAHSPVRHQRPRSVISDVADEREIAHKSHQPHSFVSGVVNEADPPTRRQRPRSVISDVCGEEPSVGDIVLEPTEGETSYQSIAVSDVLSPDGKRSHTRSKGSSSFSGAREWQPSTYRYNTINTDGELTQHSIEETAANLSQSALHAAFADLSVGEPGLFNALEPCSDNESTDLNVIQDVHGTDVKTVQDLLRTDIENSFKGDSSESSRASTGGTSCSDNTRQSLSQYPDEPSVSQYPNDPSLTQFVDETTLPQFRDTLASSRASSGSYSSDHSNPSLTQFAVDPTLSQHPVTSSTSSNSSIKINSLSQYPKEYNVLPQHPLDNNSVIQGSRISSLSQYPFDASEISQYPIESSALTHSEGAYAEGQRSSRVNSLTQYPIDSTQLSQHPIESSTRLSIGSKSSGISSSRSSVDDILMLNSKDSRPSTVIERPKTEGYNKSDSAQSSIGSKTNQSAFTPAKQSATEPQLITAANVHDIDSTFDHSIKFGHGIQRKTLGDSVLMPDGRYPVSSSTPFALINKPNARNQKPTAVDNLARYFKMADAPGNESESDTNIDKFMRKAGIDNYVNADKRESLLSDLGVEVQPPHSNKSSPSLEVELITDKGDSGVPTGSLKSPNWRELIPDTPSFGHTASQRSSGASQLFSLDGDIAQSNGSNADRLSVASQQSRRSVEGSDTGSLAGPGLVRERTNYDLYNRENEMAGGSQLHPPTRTHQSSVGSVDTLIGGYEARDAVSLMSGGSKELLQSAHTSDDDRLSAATAEKHRSLPASESGDEPKVAGSRSSSDHVDTPKPAPGSSYKDERYGAKVSGMLEGISRRQNLSARVATILAGTPPKNKNEPVSRIPVKVPHIREQATSASPQLSSAQQSNQTSTPMVPKTGSKSGAGEQTPIGSVPAEANKQKEQSDTPQSQKSNSEDEDVERMTEEYRAILKGVSNSVELNKEIDDLRAQIEESQTPTPSEVVNQERVREYMLDAADMMKSESETEDELDRDVKRILSKYGRNVGSFSDAGDKEGVVGGRESPTGSAYDTDDTLANRVQGLLKANGKLVSTGAKKPVPHLADTYHVLDDPSKSVTLPSEFGSTTKSEDTLPADLGSLKGRLQNALEGVAPAKSIPYSSDPLNDRVRKILADTTHLESEDTSSKRVSANGSPSSSVDYQNLAKDLDEIQSHLESLKGDNNSGRQSNISEQSAELLKYVEGRVEDETLRKARAVIGDSEPETESTTSSRLEPEGQGKYDSPVPRLPLSPLLTSGLVPMDIALDMIHGSAENYSRNNSAYYNLTADTDTLLKEAAEKYNRSFTPNVRPVQDPLLATGVSATDSLVDREVMEINGVKNEDSLTERVSKLVENDASLRDSHDFVQSVSRKVDASPVNFGLHQGREATSGNDSSLNISSMSPLTKKPFTAFGNVHNLFTNQMSKVSTSKFDSSPPKRHLGSEVEGRNRSSDYGGSSRTRLDEARSLSPYGREKSPVTREDRRQDRRSPTERRRTDEFRPEPQRAPSPHSRGSSPRDGVSSRASSTSSRLSLSGLRPYKPPGSKTTYYVEVGGEGEANTSYTGYSETTVESTHPGSDDAVGPTLPPFVYGSRKDPPKAEGVYTKDPASLGTIQEQSMDEHDQAKNSLRSSSKPSKSSSSQNLLDPKPQPSTATPTESRYRFTEERERSFSKTKDWLNGNWPSKEDLASVTPSKVSSESNKSESRKDGNAFKKVDTRERITDEKIGRVSGKDHVSNAERHSPSQFYSAENDTTAAKSRARTSTDVSTRSSRTSLDSYGRPAREMYDNYSDKCQELQQNYRSLKNRAEEAISKLIESSAVPLKSDTHEDLRETLKAAQRYHARHSTGRMGELEFGTPKKFGSSRLSLEMSLNDTARSKSLNDTRKSTQQDNDTGVQSLNSTGKSTSDGSSTHEFLKYHTPAGVERPSGYRGPDYWSTKVKSNYDDLSEAPPPSRLSRDSEERLIEQLRQERDARVASARHRTRAQADDGFQLLLPDEDEEIARRATSPLQKAKSPYERLNSPHARSKSPYERSTSPHARSKSPYERSNSPHARSKSPYERSNSPNVRSKSPYERLDSPHVRSKSPKQQPETHLERMTRIEIEANSRAVYADKSKQAPSTRAKSPYERSISPNGRPKSPYERTESSKDYARSKSPYEETSSNERARTKSPSERNRAKSPYERTYEKDERTRSQSPYERVQSFHAKPSTAADECAARPGEDILDFARKRVGKTSSQQNVGPEPSREEMRKASSLPTTNSYDASAAFTRPSEIFLAGLDTQAQSSRSLPEDKSQDSPDVQDVWERFSAMMQEEKRTSSNATPVNIDLEELSSILKNPTQHILRNAQKGALIEQKDNTQKPGSHVDFQKQDPYSHDTPKSTSSNRGKYADASQPTSKADVDRRQVVENPVPLQRSATHIQDGDDTQVKSRGSNGRGGDRNGRDGNDGNRDDNDNNGQKDRSGDPSRQRGDKRRDDNDENDNNEDRKRKRKNSRRDRNRIEETEEEDTDDTDELLEEAQNDEEDMADDSAQKRKMAWVIRDEELLSIPEDSTLESVSSDFTTSSEIDSDGKLVTQTTKRHLPNDPKLLKLQQKIAKQKEKYKRVQIMAQRRHNKIIHLEQLENKLEQRAASGGKYSHYSQDTISSPETTQQQTTVDSLGTVTSKTTSTPSNVHHSRLDNTTLEVSEITSTSTLTQGTVVSEDVTFERSTRMDDFHNDSDQSSVCHCCHKKRPKSAEHARNSHKTRSSPHKVSRSQSPPRSPQKRLAFTDSSPTRRKKEKIQQPPGMKLREVDYDRTISPNKTQTLPEPPQKAKRAVYMEIDLPKAVPKTKAKKHRGASPLRRSGEARVKYADKENREGKHRDEKRGSRRVLADTEVSNVSVQVTPKVKTREFGATCPTPMIPSPPTRRSVREVTMVSEAIQTDTNLDKKLAGNQRVSRKEKKTPKRTADRARKSSPGMFTPESSDNDDAWEQEQWHVDRQRNRQTATHQPKTVKPAEAAVTWFVSMKAEKPWKKPLKERQANAVALETWPQMDPYTRRALEDLAFRKTDSLGRVPSDYFPKHVPEDEEEEKKLTGLQRAFDKRMQVFISKSRERQRLVKLRADERSVNAVHGRDRDVLFQVDKKMVANVDAHPLSDLHYQPKKRFISKAEMREMAALKYKKLPEVVRACEDKKRQEFYKTNRIRAQIYKQKIVNNVMKKRTHQVKT